MSTPDSPTIQEITILGYKSIRSLTLPLNRLNILIGANGAGKSNLITCFKFLRELAHENLQLHVATRGGADAILHFGAQTTNRLHLAVTFAVSPTTTNQYHCTLVPSVEDNFVFAHESAGFHDKNYDNPFTISLGKGSYETQLNIVASQKQVASYVQKAMRGWRVYHFHDTSDTAKVKLTGDIFDNQFLQPDAANLAAYLYWLQQTQPNHYQLIRQTVRQIAPFFADFVLRPSPFNPEKIRLEWREQGAESILGASALSDGTLRFISLATLLLQPVANLPTTILLDEPELGLHPYAITLLANLLESAAAQTQIIIATQSVTLLNQFAPEDVLVVEKTGGEGTTVRQLTSAGLEQWLTEYAVGDLWEKNLLGGRPQR
jgi:predicted ATPase